MTMLDFKHLKTPEVSEACGAQEHVLQEARAARDTRHVMQKSM